LDSETGLVEGWVREWVRREVASAAPGEPTNLHERLMDVVEPALLNEVLSHLGGNRLAAARWLGIARGTVRKILSKSGKLDSGDD
jgi:DNA-binding protein Fis